MFRQSFRSVITTWLTGLLALLPLVLTLALLAWLVSLLNRLVGPSTVIGQLLGALGQPFASNPALAYLVGTLVLLGSLYPLGLAVQLGLRRPLAWLLDMTLRRAPLKLEVRSSRARTARSLQHAEAVVITRGFKSKRPRGDPSRVPPGQYVTDDFPVLSAGPTPHTPLDVWSFAVRDVDERQDVPHVEGKDGLELLARDWDRFAYIVDLTEAKRPDPETRAALKARALVINPRASHVAITVGENLLMRAMARLFAYGMGLSNVSIHATRVEAIEEARRVMGR